MKGTKKKVLFVATVDSHIELFHLPYLKMFKDKGYEVHVATNTDKKIQYCDKKHKISVERNPFKLNNLKAIRQLKKVVDTERFDVIHCHTPMGGVVARLAAKKARKNGTRMIYTAHGFHFFTGAPLKNWLLFYPVEKYLAKYTDTLITINHEDFERAKKKFSKRCFDIQYIPGVGVDEKKFSKKLTKVQKHELRKSLGLKDDDFVMIFPAELSKRKNQMWLIKTLKPIFDEDIKNHLLLPGRDNLNGKCQGIAHKLGLDGQIHFLDFRVDVDRLFKISNLAVSSSKQEGLPVNLIEAAMAGLPIVATKCRGNGDICRCPVKKRKEFIKRVKDVKDAYSELKLFKASTNNSVDIFRAKDVEDKMKKIYGLHDAAYRKCMVICWFGALPKWFRHWEYSCSRNTDYDYMIFTDQNIKSHHKNIIVHRTSLKNINELFSKKLKMNIKINNPYKLCDFKPAYGIVFDEYLYGYDFWGHCDIDLVFGKISNFVTDKILENYDIVNDLGHFKLFRNNKEINSLFRLNDSKFDYKEVFLSDNNYAFDEYSGINRIVRKNKIRHILINEYIDIDVKHKRYVANNDVKYREQCFLYDDGKLYAIYYENNKLQMKEKMYLHFQKKRPDVNTMNTKEYIIGSKGFCRCEKKLTPVVIEKTNPYYRHERMESIKYFISKIILFIKSPYDEKIRWIKRKI